MTAPEPERLIGSGAEAEVFIAGDLVAKRYRSPADKASAYHEAAILAAIEPLGLPVPAVHGVRRAGDRWEVLMTRAEGPSFGEILPGHPKKLPEYLAAMVALHRRIHAKPGEKLVGLKRKLADGIAHAEMLDGRTRANLFDGLAARPDGDRLCHGDFHPFNILGRPGNAIVVDWLDATCGDPAADVCRSYVLMRPYVAKIASTYLDAYCAGSPIHRDAILAWQPFVAAARLSEDVPEEVDGLMAMVDGA